VLKSGVIDWLTVIVFLFPALALATAIGTSIFVVAVLRSSRRAQGLCQFCGYDLRGHPRRDSCPECGKPFDFDAKGMN